MDRNYLKGHEGDRLNALLAGIGANFRKLLAAFWRAHSKLLLNGLRGSGLQHGPWGNNHHDQPLAIAA